jgi:predicted nuclease of predicted toxin-antitoxin system
VLLDSCIAAMAADVLRQAGHDVVWAGEWARDPGDAEILSKAVEASRVIATIDKDFGELVIVQGLLHVGLIRLVGFRAREQGSALVRLFATYEPDLAAGAILTAEPWRVRIRRRINNREANSSASTSSAKSPANSFTSAWPACNTTATSTSSSTPSSTTPR